MWVLNLLARHTAEKIAELSEIDLKQLGTVLVEFVGLRLIGSLKRLNVILENSPKALLGSWTRILSSDPRVKNYIKIGREDA